MKKRTMTGFAGCCLFLGIVSCANKNLAGNATQTGNPTIAGVLYQPDGKTPAGNAKVYLRKKNSLIDTNYIELMKYFADTAAATTNADGRFSIYSVHVGAYVIECTDGNDNFAIIDSMTVIDTNSTVVLPPATLKPAGAIKGVIKLSGGGDPRKVLILAFSIDRYARVNADGSFRLGSLAQGAYGLRVLPCLEAYEVLDTMNIHVTSADTTDLGTIEPPFTGIPTPQGVNIQFDTLKQVAALSWRKIDTALVKGYYVYRRNVDSNTVFERINRTLINDTLYRDIKVLPGETYEYRIAAINKNVTEGEKSSGVSVLIASWFEVDTIFGKCGTQPGKLTLPISVSVGKNGLAYVIEDNVQPRIQVFDTNYIFVRQFGETTLSRPRDGAIGADGRLFVADGGLQKVVIFTMTDSLAPVSYIAVPALQNIAVDGKNRVIATSGQDSVFVYSASGALLKKWGGTGTGQGRFDQPEFVAVNGAGTSYICDNGNKRIQIFDSTGNFKNSFAVNEVPSGIDIDPQTGRIFIVSEMGNFLEVYTADGVLMSHYTFLNYGLYNMPCGVEINGKAVYIALSGMCRIIKLINHLP